ncbi:MAG TPA: hypothetical protein VJU80_13865 [Solirubrobacteraceae bacterium]|nr:hypothetical protein [Solirubrobacteraceae bacterium]
MLATVVSFAPSTFVPLALGFFGLGTGYLIYGPQEFAGYPRRSRHVDVTTGIWGIWMPGFLQFVTGVILFVGLAWFGSFTDKPLYMAAVAFTAYGVHWWAIGMARVFGGDPRPNALMSIPFLVLSVLGAVVFFGAGDNPVGALFVGLTLVYVCDFFASQGRFLWERLLGLAHIVTGAWLMYLTVAAVLDFSRGFDLPL